MKLNKKILEIINQNKNITQKEIAEKLKITQRSVERNIVNLKEKGVVERVGSRKDGYWKIN